MSKRLAFLSCLGLALLTTPMPVLRAEGVCSAGVPACTASGAGGASACSSGTSTACLNGTNTWTATNTFNNAIVAPGAGTASTRIGGSSLAAGFNGTAVGDSASASGSFGTAVGKSALAGSNGASTAIGRSSTASGSNSTALGDSSTSSGTDSTATGQGASATGVSSTCIGTRCNVGQTSATCVGADCAITAASARGVCLGESCVVSGVGSVLLGGSAVDGGVRCFSAGRSGGCSAAGQVNFGTTTDAYTDMNLGNGPTSLAGARTAITFGSTPGTGTNIGGSELTFRSGNGSGNLSTGQNANNPTVKIQIPRPGASGAGVTTFADVLAAKDRPRTLTETTATGVVNVTTPSGSSSGATIFWTVIADDGTDFQSLHGQSEISIVNKGGTTTCQINTTVGGTPAVSAGTLTPVTVTVATGASLCQLQIAATSSLTQTTLGSYWTCIVAGPGLCTSN